MEAILFASPLLVVLLGVLAGHYFKRLVLKILTGLIIALVFIPALLMLIQPTHTFVDMIPILLFFQGTTFLVSMWITRAVKRCGGITASIVAIKNKLVDAVVDTDNSN